MAKTEARTRDRRCIPSGHFIEHLAYGRSSSVERHRRGTCRRGGGSGRRRWLFRWNLLPLHAWNLAHLLRRRPGRSRSRIVALNDDVALPLAGRRVGALGDGGGDMAGDEIRRKGLHVRDLHGDGGRLGGFHGGEEWRGRWTGAGGSGAMAAKGWEAKTVARKFPSRQIF